MFGYLLLRVHQKAGTSKRISEYSLCVLDDGVLSRTTSDAQNKLGPVSDMTTSFFEAPISSKHISVTFGLKSIMRLWLILGGWVVAIDLPAIWPITLLNRLLGGIATLGVGFGKAFLGAGLSSKGHRGT